MFVSVLQQQPAFSKSKHSVSYTRVLFFMSHISYTLFSPIWSNFCITVLYSWLLDHSSISRARITGKGCESSLVWAFRMYHPTGLDAALSYERACSKKASTFSWSARDGHPPASFIRTEMTTSWQPRKSRVMIQTFRVKLLHKRTFIPSINKHILLARQ